MSTPSKPARTTRGNWLAIAASVLIIGAVASLWTVPLMPAGCTDTAQLQKDIQDQRTVLASFQTKADAAIAEQSAALEKAKADLAQAQADANEEAVAAATAAIDAAKAATVKVTDTKAAAAAVDAKLKVVSDSLAALADGRVPEAATGLSGFLPPPWNLIVPIGATGGLALWQAIRAGKFKSQVTELTDAANSIIQGLKEAKAASPEFAQQLKLQKGVLLAHYSDTAKALVTAETEPTIRTGL